MGTSRYDTCIDPSTFAYMNIFIMFNKELGFGLLISINHCTRIYVDKFKILNK